MKASNTKSRWKRLDPPLHAHFDCFSGAAGDMMLAACLDASSEFADDGKVDSLQSHVEDCLRKGLPDLADEFSLQTKRVWKGIGSISGLHVKVHSVYNHKPVPVPHNNIENSRNRDDPFDHTHTHFHDNTGNENTNSNNSKQNDSTNNDNHSHEHHHHHYEKSDKSESNESKLSINNTTPTTELNNSTNITHFEHSHHDHDHNGPIRNLPQIQEMIENASEIYIPTWVKKKAIETFTALAEAEAYVHGAANINDVHFHEVGAVDSIIDTVGTLLALYSLGVETVSCSRLPMGEGTVWTAHGLLPVPAPATLRLMMGMSITTGPPGITGELVTPTAAALLRTLTTRISKQTNTNNNYYYKERIQSIGIPPRFTLQSIGIGAGTKNFEKHPNILRLMLGNVD